MYLGKDNNWNIPTKLIYNNSMQKSNPTNNVMKTQPKINNSIQFDIIFKEKLSEFMDIFSMFPKYK